MERTDTPDYSSFERTLLAPLSGRSWSSWGRMQRERGAPRNSDAMGLHVESSEPVGGRSQPSLLRSLRDLLIIVLVAVLVSILVKTFLVRSFYIPSGSMEPTLMVDDRVLVNELVPDLIPIQRGDVVVFKDPGGWLPAQLPADPPSPLVSIVEGVLNVAGLAAPDSADHLIKRVIGLPGDRVVCCNADGQIMVNGTPLAEPYIASLPPGDQQASDIEFDRTVPEGSLWVLGDNRDRSLDSRYHEDTPSHGFVPIENIVGRAFAVSWPIKHWASLDDYRNVFENIAP